MEDSSPLLASIIQDAPQPNPPTFPQFPQLPKELRNMIWTYAAYHPRNIDMHRINVGILTGGPTTTVPGVQMARQAFKLTSTQPPPGILHASTESRAIARKHYTLIGSTDLKLDRSIYFSAPPQIWVNPDVDRVCPMWGVGVEGWREMWSSKNHVSRCAINLAGGGPLGAQLHSNPVVLPWRIDVPSAIHKEILLYHCEKPVRTSQLGGGFEFVDLANDDLTSLRAWNALRDVKATLSAFYVLKAELYWREVEQRWKADGLEVPESEFDHLPACPKIKLVALVVGGERRS